MTDLQTILPGFPSNNITTVLERNLITTTDLLVCDAVEIAKRTGLGVLDIRGFVIKVREGLGFEGLDDAEMNEKDKGKRKLVKNGEDLVEEWKMISTLDKKIDDALGGGIPVGYITEVTGESGAGKTQLLLSLLLSAQLPPPHGLSRPTLYISTESALPTTRLRQILTSNPLLLSLNPKPSLDNIHSIITPDLESQDHILKFQLPVFVERHNIGLIILDSVAANYRAEFERGGFGMNMGKRSRELMDLGDGFRALAGRVGCAVVVSNQVGDRFAVLDGGASVRKRKWGNEGERGSQSSPLAKHYRADPEPSRSTPTPAPGILVDPPSSMVAAAELGLPHPGLTPLPHGTPSTPTPVSQTSHPNQTPGPPKSPSNSIPPHLRNRDILSLDHQQRFFTGWGDTPPSTSSSFSENLKTPSLGLIWSTQIACRIVLRKKAVYSDVVADEGGEGKVLKGWRRWLRVVFAPWVRGGDAGGEGEGGVEYEIGAGGVKAVAGDEEEGND